MRSPNLRSWWQRWWWWQRWISLTFKCSVIKADRGKGKVLPRTGHEGPEAEYRYSSTLSLTLALDGGVWSTPRPGLFTPEKETRYPFCRRLGRPQGRSGRLRKISPPPGFDPRTVQPVASRYTDYAIPDKADRGCWGISPRILGLHCNLNWIFITV
jgi:hypothetical protein